MRQAWLAIWGLMIGAVVLTGFFTSLGGVNPADVGPVMAVVGAISLMWLVRSVRIEHELSSRAGDPQLRSEFNRARERRGF